MDEETRLRIRFVDTAGYNVLSGDHNITQQTGLLALHQVLRTHGQDNVGVSIGAVKEANQDAAIGDDDSQDATQPLL